MILKDGLLAYDGSLQALRQKSGDFVVSFTTRLSEKIFTHISEVKAIVTNNQHIQLMTDNTNLLMEALMPYLNQLENLKIEQNSLETLFLEISRGVHA